MVVHTAADAHTSRVPAMYLGSAFLSFLSDLSVRDMNNLRAFSGGNGSLPTAPTNPIVFELFTVALSNKTRSSNN